MNSCPRCNSPAVKCSYPYWQCQSSEIDGKFCESGKCQGIQKDAEIERLRVEIEKAYNEGFYDGLNEQKQPTECWKVSRAKRVAEWKHEP